MLLPLSPQQQQGLTKWRCLLPRCGSRRCHASAIIISAADANVRLKTGFTSLHEHLGAVRYHGASSPCGVVVQSNVTIAFVRRCGSG